jgi:hypothetical protein
MKPHEYAEHLMEQGKSVSETADKIVNEYEQYKEKPNKRE